MADTCEQMKTKAAIRARNARAMRERLASTVNGWTRSQVEAVASTQSQGDWSSTAQLARRMVGTSPSIKSVLNKRINALTRSPLNITPGDQTRESTIVAGAFENSWNTVCQTKVNRLVSDYHMCGLTLAFLEWEMCDGIFNPVPRVLNTEFLRYDVTNRQWQYHGDDGIMDVCPGDGNWLLVTTWEYGDVVGKACELGTLWWTQQSTLNQWNDGNQRFINPIIGIKASDNGSLKLDEEEIALIINEVQNELADGVFYLQPGHDFATVDLASSYDTSAFSDLIGMIDRRITISFLGGNLSTEMAQGGSYAAAKTHHNIEREMAMGDNIIITQALRQQLIKPWAEINFGDVAVPYMSWHTEPDEDASLAIANAKALKELDPTFTPDTDSLAQAAGLQEEK